MHESFVATAPPPTYGDGWGIAGLMCKAVTFLVPVQRRVSAGLVIVRKYSPMEFTIIKSGAMTLSRSQQCRAFSRAVMDKRIKSCRHRCSPWGWGGGQWLQITGA